MPSTCLHCAAKGIEETFDKAADYNAHIEKEHSTPEWSGESFTADQETAKPKKTRTPRTPRTNVRVSPRTPRKKK